MGGKEAIELIIKKLDVKLNTQKQNMHVLQGMVAGLDEFRTICIATLKEIDQIDKSDKGKK